MPDDCVEIAAWLRNTRSHLLGLVDDLSDEELAVPRLEETNPLLWELGHVAWFHEKWILRHCHHQDPIHAEADSLYDSAAILHESRWDLRLFGRDKVYAYLADVHARTLDLLHSHGGTRHPDLDYFLRLCVFHEDMHAEAFGMTRQLLGYPQPKSWAPRQAVAEGSAPDPRDCLVPGGVFRLGATGDEALVFDNELQSHPVEVEPFRISQYTVSQSEYARFVEDHGYRNSRFWNADGWKWRTARKAEHPTYWRLSGGSWQRRAFDEWVPLEPDLPVHNVCWFEADAYCRWSGRRLPKEIEWEVAAAGEPTVDGQRLTTGKRRHPWGDGPPSMALANLSCRASGCVPVDEHARGDSAFGTRQLIGNVWEWTADDFAPYPGFTPGPYREYSQPWFGNHKVMRGGSCLTRGRLAHSTLRNFYRPHRTDCWVGFRTCHVG